MDKIKSGDVITYTKAMLEMASKDRGDHYYKYFTKYVGKSAVIDVQRDGRLRGNGHFIARWYRIKNEITNVLMFEEANVRFDYSEVKSLPEIPLLECDDKYLSNIENITKTIAIKFKEDHSNWSDEKAIVMAEYFIEPVLGAMGKYGMVFYIP